MRSLIPFALLALLVPNHGAAQGVSKKPDPSTVTTVGSVRPIDSMGVTGRGAVRVLADGVTLTAYLDGGMPGKANAQRTASIRRMLLAAKLTDLRLIVPLTFSSLETAEPDLMKTTLRNPTAQRMAATGRALASISAREPNFKLVYGGTTVFLNDCFRAESMARRVAIEDAHRRALELARTENVELGPLIQISDMPAQLCPTANQELTGNNFDGNFSQAAALEVNQALTIVYAIVRVP